MYDRDQDLKHIGNEPKGRIIIINHLFHFSTSTLHGSLSKTKMHGS